jgi:hypothetical protein
MRGPHPKLTCLPAQTPFLLQQTNTSDMLDLAVDYIKELQMQVKVRMSTRTRWCCIFCLPNCSIDDGYLVMLRLILLRAGVLTGNVEIGWICPVN